jgi:hypothetical protein
MNSEWRFGGVGVERRLKDHPRKGLGEFKLY